jgi:hypothetical protein
MAYVRGALLSRDASKIDQHVTDVRRFVGLRTAVRDRGELDVGETASDGRPVDARVGERRASCRPSPAHAIENEIAELGRMVRRVAMPARVQDRSGDQVREVRDEKGVGGQRVADGRA